MPPSTSSASLAHLVQSIVPDARNDEHLRDELIVHCQEVLSSHLGSNREIDAIHLTDIVKRHLQQTSQSNASVLRFSNLLSRLLEQPLLSRKLAIVYFLHTLASSSSTSTTASASFLPSLAPPAVSKSPTRPASALSHARDDAKVSQPTGLTKAEILRRYRAKIGRPQLPEHALLRDTLYILQGISGKYVKLEESKDKGKRARLEFTDDAQHVISASNRLLIHRLSELGHLYTRIASFVRERENKPGVGMIEQSLCHYLETQLTEYYRLIAILESQMHISSKYSKTSSGDNDVPQPSQEETGLTLKRLEVWINDWRLRLRMMSVCVEGCRDVSGGALVNLIHSYTENGDPFVRKFTDQLLEEVSKPFFAILHKWLFSGELYDPFSEFFVAVDPELANVQYIQPPTANGALPGDDGFGGPGGGYQEDMSLDNEGGLRLWESKYTFRKEMLPAFVGETFGRKIFSTGKSLNFIRYSCHDSDWVATREKLSGSGGTLQYSDIAGLERSIDTAYLIASQRLFDIFFEKFKLLDHLKAVKHYLMLGHGDFADQLMESLGPSLSRPANTLYRHNLTATLEAAIRASNAQNDPPDVLRRLDARMLEYSHGEIGWDVFTLEYKVDAPIDTVLDQETMVMYLRVFGHLWKMKRVEGALNVGWMRIAGGARTTILQVPELEIEWHQVRICMAEMIHFVRQMQTYCHLDVIELSWKELLEFCNKKEGDLDALIGAHRRHVERVMHKILLTTTNPKPKKELQYDTLLNCMKELFHMILQFREAMDDLYNYSLAEAARRDSHKDVKRGVYTENDVNRASRDTLPRILQQIRGYSIAFSEKMQWMVQTLNSHEEQAYRELATRLSFSEFYKIGGKKEKESSK